MNNQALRHLSNDPYKLSAIKLRQMANHPRVTSITLTYLQSDNKWECVVTMDGETSRSREENFFKAVNDCYTAFWQLLVKRPLEQ